MPANLRGAVEVTLGIADQVSPWPGGVSRIAVEGVEANFPSTASSTAGLSLDAQPAAFTDSVKRIGFASAIKAF